MVPRPPKPASPFRYFNSSPEVIRHVVTMYVRFPLPLRHIEDVLIDRGIDICTGRLRRQWCRSLETIRRPKPDIAKTRLIDQVAAMEISIIFDTVFRGQATHAVWIVESAENRAWFERQSGLDSLSAVFTPEGGEIGRTAVLHSIWNVKEHYPEWSRIKVMGVALTEELAADLCEEGTALGNADGFSLIR